MRMLIIDIKNEITNTNVIYYYVYSHNKTMIVDDYFLCNENTITSSEPVFCPLNIHKIRVNFVTDKLYGEVCKLPLNITHITHLAFTKFNNPVCYRINFSENQLLNITHLRFEGSIAIGSDIVFPPHLTHLTLYCNFDKISDNKLILPSNIEVLKLGSGFNYLFHTLQLPDSLCSLTVNEYFSGSLENIPISVTSLYIYSNYSIIEFNPYYLLSIEMYYKQTQYQNALSRCSINIHNLHIKQTAFYDMTLTD